jgi:hypothetical protein
VSGKRHGQGKNIFPDGSAYDGEWADDSPTGRGSFKSPNVTSPNGSPERNMPSSSKTAAERRRSGDLPEEETPGSSKTAVEAVQTCLERGLKPGSALFSKCIAGE